MATNLYETLGLDRNASPEDIRKAYHKRALKTHPDRLPPQTSEADKAAAAEEFRKVNNAYEVLSNEQNRELYDRTSIWPPRTGPEPDARGSQNFRQPSFDQPFPDPFFSSGRGFGGRSFVFTDPFVLFNSLFGDMHNMHRAFFEDDDPFFSDPFSAPSSRSPFGDPFGSSRRSPFGSFFGTGSMLSGLLDSPNTRTYSQVNEAVGRNGQWVSQSTMTRSINGRTEQITKRRDARGNEHIVYSSPEGERYTINGVDQPLPVTNGNTNPGRVAAPPPQPPPHTRPQPPAITAAPASSYYVPPAAQPVHVASPPPPYYASSVTSGPHTYPTKPAAPIDRAPARHRDAIDVDPLPGARRYRSTSSAGHGSPYAPSLRSNHSDRERERHSHHSYRDADGRRSSHSHRSHRDYQPAPESVRTAEGDAHHDKKGRLGGWLSGITKLLTHRVRRHSVAH
ncbi:DnaJ-domain-containing protein [Daedalea quercina L-15889]|uniref:DnaJ-domain-containing protein n=1 Tax=Daedalea quercina L-15889 TaxID=1314783 RepID=A0A165MIT8_9APHY|nr:DnaJ-domain-containing protein [Daedalea quercina L-15889]